MKIITFNVNGVRARLHQLEALIQKHEPEVIGLQEIKVADEDFPVEAMESLGYHIEYFGQKTHYGVGLMSKQKPLRVQKGYLTDTPDAQRRIILADYKTSGGQLYTVINGYFPQGESRDHPVKFPAKKQFYADLMTSLNHDFTPESNLAVMGDFNISSTDADIGIGADNAKRWLRTGKCSFLPEEREWFQTLLNWGLQDCYREIPPENEDELYSWFDYRSRGFEREPKRGLRIDGILATASMMDKCLSTGIDYDIRSMEKPSDHAPLWADFDF
ncbi:exodeoxyribonuclease III [Endozoicomonas montiporae]|uniref:Exodeoxyribonuclease III n=2 Tax=Endozoicomonas montiporae TaxID=1027273 RepID=A0A081NB24_9GAMM|nr:exodeoxyribonuclease III [Endozoicomonas montiporae]AMO56646.1 exodeoxyribonuclease III [Endozoicomonas montiporae CL-33]KEQ15647.1 exodeoxyribonuclease III [Endozoicomonas montiporae]